MTLTALMVTLLAPAGAQAYWTSSGSGSGSGNAGTLAAPTNVIGTPGAGTVALSWSAVTPPGSGTVSYYVSRNGGDAGGTCPTSSLPSSSPYSCIDSGLAADTYSYTVTAVWQSWTARSPVKEVTVSGSPPVNTVLPDISGDALQDETLLASNGSWDYSPTGFTYQWRRCDFAGSTCSNISGATSSTYTLVAADSNNHTVRVVVTASNAYGATSATSDQTALVDGLAPIINATPVISGTATQGQTLSTTTGSWDNLPTGYAYQWLRCDSAGSNCSYISGATSSSYTLVYADAGSTIEVRVTASNSDGSTSVISDRYPNPGTVQGLAPSNTVLPALSGTATQGQTLSATTGSWDNSPTGYTYQWRRCDSTGSNCSDISGATSSTYTLVYADAGGTVRVVVTASNSYGSTAATSAKYPAAVTVQGLAPVNNQRPAISGAATEGQTLSATTGSWANSPTGYAYKWQRCDSAGSNCADISGATSSTYTLVDADSDNTIRVVVTATNPYGSTVATSSQTSLVRDGAPINTAPPVISGTATQGQTLSTTNGSWDNSPTGYTYQWMSCDSAGGNCSDISGATSSTYTLVAADAGSTIVVEVTASNAYGSTPVLSGRYPNPGTVQGLAPANTVLPVVSGTATQGQTLSATNGSWDNSPTSSAFQWQRCDAAGANCSAISGATSGSYTLVYADAGHTVRVVVTASNTYGSTPATSANYPTSGTVQGLPPLNTVLPVISGTTKRGQTLSATTGSWADSPTSNAFQWQRCNRSGGSCSNIAGATSSTYVLGNGSASHVFRVVVTAMNAYGSTAATSNQTAVVTK